MPVKKLPMCKIKEILRLKNSAAFLPASDPDVIVPVAFFIAAMDESGSGLGILSRHLLKFAWCGRSRRGGRGHTYFSSGEKMKRQGKRKDISHRHTRTGRQLFICCYVFKRSGYNDICRFVIFYITGNKNIQAIF